MIAHITNRALTRTFEKLTGLGMPVPAAGMNRAEQDSLLGEVAVFCATVLRVEGYLDGESLDRLVGEYRMRLAFRVDGGRGVDFLQFLAGEQERERGLAAREELRRMQKVIHAAHFDRMSRWTFGPLPGQPGDLYDAFPSARCLCRLLGCPAVFMGDASVVHVASANPVAAHLSAHWLLEEMALTADGEAPFVFAFVIEPTEWETRRQVHFPEDSHEF